MKLWIDWLTSHSLSLAPTTSQELTTALKRSVSMWMGWNLGALHPDNGRVLKFVKASEDIERRAEVEIDKDFQSFPTRLLDLEAKDGEKPKTSRGKNDTGRAVPTGHYWWCLVLGTPNDEKPLIEKV